MWVITSEEGLAGVGKILREITIQGIPVLQLSSQEVTSGFSGAPVWDVEARRVVGMITAITPPDAYQRLAAAAFAIPSDSMVSICPQLATDIRAFDLPRPPYAVEPVLGQILQSGKLLNLQGKRYLVREVIAQRAFGALVVRTARASDLSMRRDVGIRQVDALSEAPEVQASLSRIVNYAQILGQVATLCEHLPQIYDIVDQSPHTVWRVVEWIRGSTIEQFLPKTGPLPDVSALLQLLSWAADVCDALAALKCRRLSHAGVREQTICISPSRRRAVLIAPCFVASLGPVAATPVPFDPAKDVRDLAATIYRVATHQVPQTVVASEYNPVVPVALDGVLRDALSGSVRRPDRLKRRLLAARRAI